jgi:hypothetical protein
VSPKWNDLQQEYHPKQTAHSTRDMQGASLTSEQTMLVTEYMEGGDLLHNIAAGRVSWYKRGRKVGAAWFTACSQLSLGMLSAVLLACACACLGASMCSQRQHAECCR